MVARLNGVQEAVGSTPATPTKENLEKWLNKAKFQVFFFILNISFKELKYAFLRRFTANAVGNVVGDFN